MPGVDPWILGLNCYDHDVSACLIRDGEIVAAINKERLTRIKHDAGFHQEVVDYCLEAAGIAPERLDLVVRNSYVLPVREMETRLAHHHQPLHLPASERERALASPHFLPDPEKVVEISHHLAHAYSAFAVSPFEEGAVMVVDGVGSYRADVTETVPSEDESDPLAREAESYYLFRRDTIETVKKVWLPPARGFLSDEFYAMAGLGALYSRVSTYVFGHWNKCGEVMGLAPYGRPGLEPLVRLEDTVLTVPDWDAAFRRPFVGGSDREWERSPQRRDWEDLAWRVQEDTERVLLARARWLRAKTGAKDLCIAGGVGLNCVANAKILAQSGFERVFVQPAAGDDGIALGCAYYGHCAVRERPRTFVMRSAALGRRYDHIDVEVALRPATVRLTTHRRKTARIAEETARLLADGKVVGWFQGRSEFGPRALGHRSILADPREARMKDHVNARVKHRQAFRPFAPAVLAERAQEFFDGEEESPFMLLVKRVRPEARDKVAAIVHVDGTARVQTVREEDDPLFHALIRRFGELTGVPVVLNTSFNLRGEPIVETPDDAVDCFLRSKLDALVLHDRILTKRATHRWLYLPLLFLRELGRNLDLATLRANLTRRLEQE